MITSGNGPGPFERRSRPVVLSRRYPSHCGLETVPSNWVVVLNGSDWPVAPGAAVLGSKEATSLSPSGRKVRAASSACSRVVSETQPVMATDVGRVSASCRHQHGVAVLG